MTARQAIEQADALRPNNPFEDDLKQLWLRQADGQLRREIVDKNETAEFDEVGADLAAADRGLDDDTVLLLPDPYAAAYHYWLCAQMDLALGEADRYALDAGQYNTAVQTFAAQLRQRCKPKSTPHWKY